MQLYLIVVRCRNGHGKHEKCKGSAATWQAARQRRRRGPALVPNVIMVGATNGKGWQNATKRQRPRIWRSPPNPLGATHRRWWTLNAALLIEPWPSRRGFAVNQCGRRSDLISSDYNFSFLNHFFGTDIYLSSIRKSYLPWITASSFCNNLPIHGSSNCNVGDLHILVLN